MNETALNTTDHLISMENLQNNQFWLLTVKEIISSHMKIWQGSLDIQ